MNSEHFRMGNNKWSEATKKKKTKKKKPRQRKRNEFFTTCDYISLATDYMHETLRMFVNAVLVRLFGYSQWRSAREKRQRQRPNEWDSKKLWPFVCAIWFLKDNKIKIRSVLGRCVFVYSAAAASDGSTIDIFLPASAFTPSATTSSRLYYSFSLNDFV